MKLLWRLVMRSGLVSRPPAFTVTLDNLTNATGGGTTSVFLNAGSDSLITPSLVVSRTSGVAPLGVHFDATGTTAASVTSRPIHDVWYSWTFGDAGSGTWANGTRPGVSSRNEAFGPVAAHVFETAGDHTVTLYCMTWDGTRLDMAPAVTQVITVAAADTEWAGTKTVCYSTNTDFTGAPSGCVQVPNVTNIAASILANKGSGNIRHLLHAGQTFGLSTSLVIDTGGPSMIGRFGSGSNPVVNRTANVTMMTLSKSTTPTGVSDWRFVDITMEGNSHASACISGEGSCSRMLFLRLTTQNHGYGLTLSGSLMEGLNASVPFTHAPWDDFYLADCSVLDINVGNGPCGIFGSCNRMAVLGCLYDPNGGGEHGIRLQLANRCIFSDNTIQRIAVGKANLSLRGVAFAGNNTVPAGTYTEKCVVSGNRLVGGASPGIMGIGPQNSYNDERGRNIIVERNYFVGSASTVTALTCAQPDVTIRNNIVLLASGGFLDLQKSDMVPAPTNIGLYNNSVYSSVSGGGGFIFCAVSVDVGTGFEQVPAGTITVTSRNNLCYAPNAAAWSKLHENLYTTGSYTTSNNTSDAQIRTTSPLFATTPPTLMAHFAPGSGSYANGAGIEVQIRKDAYGTTTQATPDMGAVLI